MSFYLFFIYSVDKFHFFCEFKKHFENFSLCCKSMILCYFNFPEFHDLFSVGERLVDIRKGCRVAMNRFNADDASFR